MQIDHCRFGYQYRDASNYKAFNEILLVGAVTSAVRAAIEEKLNDDGMFVPEFVGLVPLQASLDNFPSDDDHIWHEFLYLLPATDWEIGRVAPWGQLSQLLANFQELDEWTSPDMLRRIALLFDQEPYSLFR